MVLLSQNNVSKRYLLYSQVYTVLSMDNKLLIIHAE